MSERKGGAHKVPRKTIKIGEPHDDRLIALAQAAKNPPMTKRALMEYLIDLCDEYHFENPGWRDRFNQGLDNIELDIKESLSGLCPAFQKVNEIYQCIWARKNKPPVSKKLSGDMTQAQKVCDGCERTREILDGIEGYEETIRTLKKRAKKGIVVEIPRCDFPSELSEDGLSFWCRRQSKRMTVEQCKKLRKGRPLGDRECVDLKWLSVPVKGELAEPEK